jgi:hypothetical protein
MNQPDSHPIDEYAKWALSVWRLEPELGHFPTPHDFTIIGLGLPGECGELLALTDGAAPLDTALAIKELGDALYYWSLLCLAIGDAPSSHWPNSQGRESLGADHGLEAARERAVALTGAACEAAEGLKKMLRDQAPPERLRQALDKFAPAWIGLCHALGFSWREAVEANQEKIRGRQERGTLLGCGDDR